MSSEARFSDAFAGKQLHAMEPHGIDDADPIRMVDNHEAIECHLTWTSAR
jgi:hypothetical protein